MGSTFVEGGEEQAPRARTAVPGSAPAIQHAGLVSVGEKSRRRTLERRCQGRLRPSSTRARSLCRRRAGAACSNGGARVGSGHPARGPGLCAGEEQAPHARTAVPGSAPAIQHTGSGLGCGWGTQLRQRNQDPPVISFMGCRGWPVSKKNSGGNGVWDDGVEVRERGWPQDRPTTRQVGLSWVSCGTSEATTARYLTSTGPRARRRESGKQQRFQPRQTNNVCRICLSWRSCG
jgi:hypothetical protein